MKISRNNFIKKIGLTGLASLCIPQILLAANHPNPFIKNKGLTILFQGDSITDGNRTRDMDWNHIMGHGYAYLIASRLWHDYLGKDLMFYNRGISGDKIKDLENR
ncbi:hypothetical protein GGR42_002219 [Saonia flava]|uniref:Uncharacterized protein n=1 Tax=Saonia flava TaxID=523696 RepID=A0A846QX02_9FLAO|nr:hypothetical protein [Saonia flava]NJB71757.1 hypothetical protein [Saonia flava]